MKKFLVLLFSSLLALCMHAESANNKVDSIIKEVRIDSLFSYINCLSGEWEIYIGEDLTRISSRAFNHPGNKLAGTYLYDMLKSFGYTPVRDTFDFQGQKYYNIIVEKRGTDTPEEVYILCGHYDSFFNTGGDSPGADDNASGTAALLEAARILAGIEFKSTIRLIFFNVEETGIDGSYDYARRLNNANTPPKVVINIDMIAYDGNNDDKVLLIHNTFGQLSKKYAEWSILVNEDFGIGLKSTLLPTEAMGSDHCAFWIFDMAAIAIHEDYADFNPAYHTTGDRMDLFNNDYYLAMTRLAIGSVCSFADGIYSGVSGKGSTDAFGIFPNPVSAYLNVIPKSDNVLPYKITMYNSMSSPVLKYEALDGGPARISIAEHNLPSGFYLLRIETGESVYNEKIIISN